MLERERIYSDYRKALKLLEKNRFAQAAFLLEGVKREEPRKGSVREALGRAYYNWGRFERSEVEFRAAVEIDPTNHYAHFGLGLSLLKQGELKKASRHLKLALAMSPEDEDYKKALRALEKLDKTS
jgi:tetratricopeptide (TPR) repeat protein